MERKGLHEGSLGLTTGRSEHKNKKHTCFVDGFVPPVPALYPVPGKRGVFAFRLRRANPEILGNPKEGPYT